jgi:hypothetical protein
MKRIDTEGNLPKPIKRLLGLSDVKTQNALWDVFGYPMIIECTNVEEFGKFAHEDECEIQTLIDQSNSRYYLTAMSIDPERIRQKVDELVYYDLNKGKEVATPTVVPDDAPKPTTIVFYIEISEGEYKKWAQEDAKRRVEAIVNKRTNGGVYIPS